MSINTLIAEFNKNNPLYLRIKVIPRSSKTEISDILADGAYKIRISAPPEKNKANKKLIQFLSKQLQINPNNIKIISGHADKIKLIKIQHDQ